MAESRDPEVEARKMEEMDRWLDAVCGELGLEMDVVDRVRHPMLDMIAEVAHGPSRPGAPMTAMLVGLASATDDPDAVLARVEKICKLVKVWENE